MSFIDSIYEKAKAVKQTIAVPECTNEYMMIASAKAFHDGMADIVYVGDPAEIQAAAEKYGLDIAGIRIVDLMMRLTRQNCWINMRLCRRRL